MAKQTYILKPFESSKASSGVLCVMVKNGISDKITNINSDGTTNPNFMGAGICTQGNGGFTMMINGVVYQFNSKGEGLHPLSIRTWKLMLGEIEATINTSGNAATSNTTTIVTRGQDGSTTTKVDYSKTNDVIIDSLNARDEFAVNVLKQLLSSVPNPSALSNNEMNFFCNRAYQWAANMMEASANARGSFTQEASTTTGTPSNVTTRADVTTESLSSNTEKLLNNIVSALERTYYAETVSGKVIYHDRVKVQFTELMDFLKTYVKNGESVVGLKDLISAINKDLIASLGKINDSNSTVLNKLADIAVANDTTVKALSRTSVTHTESIKTLSNTISNQAKSIESLSNDVENLKSQGITSADIDARVKAWLNATTIVSDDNGGYKLNVPSSI